MRKIYLLLLLIFSVAFILYGEANENDSIDIVVADTMIHYGDLNDTVKLLNDKSVTKQKKEREHSPQRATILSAVVPGLGQAYNRKYWKIPIIYIAGGAIYYFISDNNDKYLKYKDLYENEHDKHEEADKGLLNTYYSKKEYFRKWRDYNIIFIGLLYVANIVDAMVDAYLLKFNVGDDLSLRIEPNLDQIPSQYAFDNFSYGVKFSFNF